MGRCATEGSSARGSRTDTPHQKTFWFSSSVLGGRWVFLGQSPARVDEVSLGDFDGDGRCDASAQGQVFLNPDPLPFARNPGNVSALFGTPAALTLFATGGSRPYSCYQHALRWFDARHTAA